MSDDGWHKFTGVVLRYGDTEVEIDGRWRPYRAPMLLGHPDEARPGESMELDFTHITIHGNALPAIDVDGYAWNDWMQKVEAILTAKGD